MAAAPSDASRGHAETKETKESKDAKAPDSKEGAAAAPSQSRGIKQWIPLLIAVVSMPALAFATTRFVLLPKMQQALDKQTTAEPSAAPAAASSESAPASKEGTKSSTPGKTKILVPMNKMLVNVSGTMGTRYLMTSVTLVGNNADFKSKIEDNKDQLMDLATGTLGSKTISDLEKPGARNLIRSELMTVINNALGAPLVQEIYITELAIQ